MGGPKAARAAHREKDQADNGNDHSTSKNLTLRWFFENRFRPMMEPKWKESSRKELIGNIERYVLRPIGDTPLAQIDKFMLQMHANRLAETYSDSVVGKYLLWTNAILEEALDQDLLSKNPARKLEKPQTRPVNKRVAKEVEIRIIMQCMEPKMAGTDDLFRARASPGRAPRLALG